MASSEEKSHKIAPMKLHEWKIIQPLANSFRLNVSGSKDGRPEWVDEIADPGGVGLYGPESAVWKVHGSLSTLVGGVRALLLQAAHPAPLQGVAEHSRYQTDPIGRLIGTTRWLTITSFAAEPAIRREAKRVNAMHQRVQGEYLDKTGVRGEYSAKNERFLLWVHCAFTDSFLKSYCAIHKVEPHQMNAYVHEWAKSATFLGLPKAPQSVDELERTLDDFRVHDLYTNEGTKEVIHFILNPPFGLLGRIFYRVISNAAIATLDERDRQALLIKKKSRAWISFAARALALFHAILGPEPPSMKVARERIARATIAPQANGT